MKKASKHAQELSHRQQRKLEARRKARRKFIAQVGIVSAVGVVILFLITLGGSRSDAKPYQVGDPKAGEVAPDFSLASTQGGQWKLSNHKGKTVLLYFQEGLACGSCWTQISDMEKNTADLKAAGIDEMVTITADPIALLKEKANDEKYATAVLSDPGNNTADQYNMREFGMMQGMSSGHSFVVVGPDGTIKWRADYGGAPKYTMYVPTKQLLADMKKASA